MRLFTIALLSTFLAGGAYASLGGGGGSRPEPPPTPSTPPTSSNDADNKEVSGNRAEAERSYAQAYDEVTKAKDEVEKGKDKNAKKQFKKALEHAQHAADLDAKYHEAWNLVGYCSRKLGDYDKAFAAYDKCLAIKWDYAPAREYLGEAYLEKGDDKKAHEQLALLQKSSTDSEEASRLMSAIQTYEKAHPEAIPAATETPATASSSTPADSTSGNH